MAGTRVEYGSFAIVANGFSDGPAQALRDFLNGHKARSVVTVFNPLVAEDGGRSEISRYEGGKLVRQTTVGVPIPPPYSFVLDPVVPPKLPRVDAWFGFNNVAAARGLLARRLGRAEKVAYWCVDFVPNRFGRSPATWVYDKLDKLASTRSDIRYELSDAALIGRNARMNLPESRLAPTHVVPMGAWTASTPKTPPNGHRSRLVVYLGHLVERQGVDLLLRAAALERSFRLRIIGGGAEENRLRALVEDLRLGDRVEFHGFVESFREVQRLLAECAIGAAPYREDLSSFTRYADPGKLKAYLAAGLPIVMTSTPPNAEELSQGAGAELLAYSEEQWADAIVKLLDDPAEWATRRESALRVASQFDWETLLGEALERLGFQSEP